MLGMQGANGIASSQPARLSLSITRHACTGASSRSCKTVRNHVSCNLVQRHVLFCRSGMFCLKVERPFHFRMACIACPEERRRMVFERVRRLWQGPLLHGGTRDVFARSFSVVDTLKVDKPALRLGNGAVRTVRICQNPLWSSVGTLPARSRTPSSKCRCWMSLSTATHLVFVLRAKHGIRLAPHGCRFRSWWRW